MLDNLKPSSTNSTIPLVSNNIDFIAPVWQSSSEVPTLNVQAAAFVTPTGRKEPKAKEGYHKNPSFSKEFLTVSQRLNMQSSQMDSTTMMPKSTEPTQDLDFSKSISVTTIDDNYGQISYDYIRDLFNDEEAIKGLDLTADDKEFDWDIPEDLKQQIFKFEDDKEIFIKQLKEKEEKELNTILSPWIFEE